MAQQSARGSLCVTLLLCWHQLPEQVTTVHPSTAVTHCSNLMAIPDALVITLTGVLLGLRCISSVHGISQWMLNLMKGGGSTRSEFH